MEAVMQDFRGWQIEEDLYHAQLPPIELVGPCFRIYMNVNYTIIRVQMVDLFHASRDVVSVVTFALFLPFGR